MTDRPEGMLPQIDLYDGPTIRKAYDGSRNCVLTCADDNPSMVRQSFKDECDITKIMERYGTTGLAPITQREPIFADVSGMVDLKTSLDTIAELEGRLKELPAEARELFRKNPRDFSEALAAAETRDQLVELGVLAAEEDPPAADPDPAPTPPPEPTT